MEDQNLKVLMLGWEYPPLVSGGLGAASFGIANALAKVSDLTLIIPKTTPESKLNHAKLIGLNELDFEDNFEIEIERKLQKTIKITYVDAAFELFPYGEVEKVEKKEEFEEVLEIEHKIPKPSKLKQLFNEEEIYGKNVFSKLAAYAEQVATLAKDLEFDVIHAHDWVTFPAAMLLAEQTGKPFFAHIHSLETDRVSPQAIDKVFEIEQKAMQAAALVFPVSDYTKQRIIEHYDIPVEKLCPIHNGIDATVPLQETITKTSDVKKVLFLGRVTRQKGPTFLVETAVHLISKMPDLRFVIVGTGDRLRGTMLYAKQRGIMEYFDFVGHLDKQKVAEILQEVDAYFLPSVSEPFGLATLEAAQAGLPVVISEQSGAKEVLEGALKSDYWDILKFANYLYAVLNYEGLRKQLAENNRQQLLTLTWEKVAEDILYYYGLVLNREI